MLAREAGELTEAGAQLSEPVHALVHVVTAHQHAAIGVKSSSPVHHTAICIQYRIAICFQL